MYFDLRFYQLIFILLFSGVLATAGESGFSQALSCTQDTRALCTDKVGLQKCQEKLAICRSLISTGAIDSSLEMYLVTCESQMICIVKDSKAMLNGCSRLAIDGWDKVEGHLQAIRKQLSAFEKSCAEQSTGYTDPRFRKCVLQKLPSFHLPENLDFLFAYSEKRFNSVSEWFQKTKGLISESIAKECERLRGRPDKSFNQCRFTHFMNGLLQGLEQPYSTSSFKSITDLLVDAYVVRVSEHSKSTGCLNPEGSAREFCAMMAVLSTKTVEAALEMSDFVPNPKSVARNVGEELVEQGKGLSEKGAKTARPQSLRRQKGSDLPEDIKNKRLADVLKSPKEIQNDYYRDFGAMTAGPKSANAEKLVWPRTPLAKRQADELANMYQEGQKLDFDTKNPVEQAKIMDKLKKVADKYAEIYRSQGYEVRIEKFNYKDEDKLGGYHIVLEASANPKVVNILNALYDKHNVKELRITVDNNFFNNRFSGASYISEDSPYIELGAIGRQDPSRMLNDSVIFHEIHHAYYEKSRLARKDLPYYGVASFDDKSNTVISLNGYNHLFHAEEIAAYRKQLGIANTEKVQSYATRDNLKLEYENKKDQLADLALSYREAARSTLRILDNIEKSISSSPSYLKSVKYDVKGILDSEPSKATLPLMDTNNKKIGEFTINLINLNRNEKSDQEAMVKAYLQQMKEAATKDYLEAEAKIEFLKQQANPQK